MVNQILPKYGLSALVICVNYHDEQNTVSFVNEILQQECSDSLRLIIVDNSEGSSSDPRLLHLAKADSRVQVMKAPGNLGYFGGANWALRLYLAGAPLPDWIIVSNSDISFIGRDFLIRLFTLYPDNAPSVVAPSILSKFSGTDQNPYMEQRPSSARMHFYKWVFRYYPTFVIYNTLSLVKHKMQAVIPMVIPFYDARKKKSKQPRAIYAPHGSFIIFHRSYFEAGGSLEYDVFLFGEEIFIAETARRLGLTVFYDPRLVVLHSGKATTGKFKSRKMARFIREASSYCADKFFS